MSLDERDLEYRFSGRCEAPELYPSDAEITEELAGLSVVFYLKKCEDTELVLDAKWVAPVGQTLTVAQISAFDERALSLLNENHV
jgi:hypothetical protein